MSIMHKVLAAIGLQLTKDTDERKVLDELARCTDNDEQYLAALRQAVTIVKMGGINDERLEALVALGTVGMMLPATEKHLQSVGIDTRPWREIEAEWRAARS